MRTSSRPGRVGINKSLRWDLFGSVNRFVFVWSVSRNRIVGQSMNYHRPPIAVRAQGARTARAGATGNQPFVRSFHVVRDRLNAFSRAREPATPPRLNVSAHLHFRGRRTAHTTLIHGRALFPRVAASPSKLLSPRRERPCVRKDNGVPRAIHHPPSENPFNDPPRHNTRSVLAHFNSPSEGWSGVALGRRLGRRVRYLLRSISP